MDRRQRVDVVEGQRPLVLVDLPARDLAAQDAGEDVARVVGHAAAPPAGCGLDSGRAGPPLSSRGAGCQPRSRWQQQPRATPSAQPETSRPCRSPSRSRWTRSRPSTSTPTAASPWRWRRSGAATGSTTTCRASSATARAGSSPRARPFEVRRERGNHVSFGAPETIDLADHGRGPDAPGPALQPRLHLGHPPARPHPPADAGGQRPAPWSATRPRSCSSPSSPS